MAVFNAECDTCLQNGECSLQDDGNAEDCVEVGGDLFPYDNDVKSEK